MWMWGYLKLRYYYYCLSITFLELHSGWPVRLSSLSLAKHETIILSTGWADRVLSISGTSLALTSSPSDQTTRLTWFLFKELNKQTQTRHDAKPFCDFFDVGRNRSLPIAHWWWSPRRIHCGNFYWIIWVKDSGCDISIAFSIVCH